MTKQMLNEQGEEIAVKVAMEDLHEKRQYHK